MTVLASDKIAHGPLEALFTVDEETGMTGAFGLKKGLLKGDILIIILTQKMKENCTWVCAVEY
jgi:dipeptidase D